MGVKFLSMWPWTLLLWLFSLVKWGKWD
jgi:hypothetical protein